MSGQWPASEADPTVDGKIAAHNASDQAHADDLTARFAAHNADEDAHADLIAGVAATLQARSEKGQAGGYASLDGAGAVPSSQLPGIALTRPFVVGSQAEQLALSAQQGDVAVRTDENRSYVHNGGSAGTLDDWTLLRTPTDAVLSVNGETGAVDLTAADVGAASTGALITESTTRAVADAELAAADTALDGRVDALEVAPPAHVHPIAGVTGLQGALDGKASLQAVDDAVAELAVLDVAGHSLTLGGYAERIARARGARTLRHLGVGGAQSFIPAGGPADVGAGGWGWVLGTQFAHRVMSRQGWPPESAAWMPPRSAGVLHFGLNDFPKLGVARPAPWLEAMRSMIAHWRGVATVRPDDATVTTSGVWSALGLAGYFTGPTTTGYYTSAEGAYKQWAFPAHWPGGMVAVHVFVAADHDLTMGVSVNGVAQPTQEIVGTALCGSSTNGGAADRHNMVTRRYMVPAGASTLRVTLDDLRAGVLCIDSIVPEAEDDRAPVIAVIGMNRPLTYGVWGNPAGMTDANVMAWDDLLKALVAEFPSSVRHVDIDTPLAKSATHFVSDGAHLNGRGDELVGEAVMDALDAAWTRDRALASLGPAAGRTRLFNTIMQPAALAGTWVQGGTVGANGEEWFGIQQDLDGRVTLSGRVTGGGTSAVVDLPAYLRPARKVRGPGYQDGGTIQRWEVDPSNGRVTIAGGFVGGVSSNLTALSWYPAVT